MPRPQLSWLPDRLLRSLPVSGHPSLEHCLQQAYLLGLRWLEVPFALLPARAPEVLRAVVRRLERQQLGIVLLLTSPDLANPEPDVRARHAADVQAAVEAARLLNVPVVRVTAGCEHPDAARSDGLIWATEELKRLAEAADRRGVQLAVENHFRDRGRHCDDFACGTAAFEELCARLESSPIGVCFNAGAPLVFGEDPVPLLEALKTRVCHVHMADRMPGTQRQTPLGDGDVDFDAILSILADTRYRGFIGYEDANPRGDAGTQAGLRYLRAKVARWWW